MKKVLGLTLGIMTAMGGFIDIRNLVVALSAIPLLIMTNGGQG